MAVISERVRSMSASASLSMAKKARELMSTGVDVIMLNLGEPDFDTPEHIRESGKEAIDSGYSKYAPISGYLDLKQAIVNKLKKENGLEYNPSEVVVTAGAKPALSYTILALINPLDEVIIPTPYWGSYSEMVNLASGKSVLVKTDIENNFKITPKQLEDAITEKTKLFMFSSPSNPTGSIYSEEELSELVKVFERYPDIYILSDEIYEYLNFTGTHTSIAKFNSIKSRVIVVNGLSKAYAMTGWRIGYLAADRLVVDAIEKVQSQISSSVNSVTQRAALTALTSEKSEACVNLMKKEFKRRRDLVFNWLSGINNIKLFLPDGAFYFFIDISYFFGKSYQGHIISDADDLCMLILTEAKVSLVSGISFGDKNCLRISFASSESVLKEAVNRISEFLNKIN